MIVITLTSCPQALRGEITLWFQEISTGVFVGKVSARVRDNVWDRIIKNIKNGQATMSYSTNNEQGYMFRVHNTAQKLINYDGLNLVLWPNKNENNIKLELGFSKASKMKKAREFSHKKSLKDKKLEYVVVDVETTGLNPMTDKIIQVSALHVINEDIVNELNYYVSIDFTIPVKIEKLTGINDKLLKEEGKTEYFVLKALLDFIGNKTIVGHNVTFDISFLLVAMKNLNLGNINNKYIDTLSLAKKKIFGAPSYKLSKLAQQLGCNVTEEHSAKTDCLMTKFIYEELIKKG